MNNRAVQIILLLLTITLLVLVAFNAPGWLLLLLLLIILLLLLWWLFGGNSDGGDEERPFSDPNYPPEEYFIENQVVVRGPLTAVTRAILSVRSSVQLRLVNRIAFSELDEAIRNCLGNCSQIDFADFVIDLYELDGSYEEVAEAIRAINRAVGTGSDVQAEPNLLSGHPWEPFGSPWEPFGSPWEPFGSGLKKDHQAPPSSFMEQWAFTEIGLPDEEIRSGGRGVRIGVFDTSPFGEDDLAAPQSPVWVNEPNQLTLDLAHYPTPTATPGDPDLSSHGLFAAGLAHAVAPEATIQLIRVLGSQNKGDLYSLNLAIFEFILANTTSQQEDTIGAVINMSLGIRVPPDHAGFNLPTEVQSLRDLLRAAQCAQIVVVAAAGNNSANLPQPEPANLPANWPEIMGVASSTQARDRSCFSNQGNLAAPGGNGRSNGKECIPANDTCEKPECPYAVIGPVLKTDDNTGYAYWSGTSFAAPMVTGLAALVIEKGRGKLSPQEVRRIIECGATQVEQPHLGNRIIHVSNTLAHFEDCAKELNITLDSPNQQAAE